MDLSELYGISEDVISPPTAPPKRIPAKKTPPEDSVSIDKIVATASKTSEKEASKKTCKVRPGGLKMLILLFLSFLLVVSDVFTNSVVGFFSGAVKARSPTSYGIIIQGICLVLLFIVSSHLVDVGIL